MNKVINKREGSYRRGTQLEQKKEYEMVQVVIKWWKRELDRRNTWQIPSERAKSLDLLNIELSLVDLVFFSEPLDVKVTLPRFFFEPIEILDRRWIGLTLGERFTASSVLASDAGTGSIC